MDEAAKSAHAIDERSAGGLAAAAPPPVAGYGLATYLVLLGFAIAVPALIFSGYLLYRFATLEREGAVTAAQDAAASIRNAVDREIASMATQLKVISNSTQLQTGDFRSFHAQASASLTGTDTYVALVDPATYQPLLSTRLSYGTPLTQVSDKTAIDEPLRTGDIYVSDVVFSTVAKDHVVSVGLPVAMQDGRRYVLLITRSAATFAPLVRQGNLAPGWQGTLIDRQGKVIASTADEPTGSPAKILTVPSAGEGTVAPTTVDIDGRPTVFAIRQSFDTGWRVAAWVPAAVIEEPLWTPLTLLALAGLALLLLTALLAVMFGRRVSRPLLLLADQARALGRGEVASEISTPVREVNEVSRTLTAAADERKKTEDHIRFLMRELSHRAKNQLAVVVAMARRTAESNKNVTDFENVFSERLLALARSTDLLVNQNWVGVAVGELVAAHLSPFADKSRLMMDGPAIQLNPDAAQNIGLALHELATNAAKYGSLSAPEGTVTVVWRVIRGSEARFRIEWVERDGPEVAPPSETGFGSVVIQRTVANSLNADVDHQFHPTGVTWSLELPLEAVASERVGRRLRESA